MLNFLSTIKPTELFVTYGSYGYYEPEVSPGFTVFSVILAVVVLVLYYSVCRMIVDIAVQKGHDKGHLFAVCFWLGIPGMICVASLPDLKLRDMVKSSERMVKSSERVVNSTVSVNGLKADEIPTVDELFKHMWKCGSCGTSNFGSVCTCGAWKCPKCGSENSKAVGTCSCGTQKPRR